MEAVSSPRSLQILLSRITGSMLIDAHIRTELPERHVLRAIASPVRDRSESVFSSLSGRQFTGTTEAPGHTGSIRVDVLGVQLICPGRFLVVLRAHRAQQSGSACTETACPCRAARA